MQRPKAPITQEKARGSGIALLAHLQRRVCSVPPSLRVTELTCSSHRLRGSYHNLHYGYLPDALVDLTGGVVTSIDVTSSSTDLLLLIQAAAQAGSLITCATPAGVRGGDMIGEELVGFHSGTPIQVALIGVSGGTVREFQPRGLLSGVSFRRSIGGCPVRDLVKGSRQGVHLGELVKALVNVYDQGC